jgi:hypothetical protein
MTNGQGPVFVGMGHLILGYEAMAWHPAQGRHHGRCEFPATGLDGGLLGEVGDFFHETLPRAIEIGGGQWTRHTQPKQRHEQEQAEHGRDLPADLSHL